MTNQYINLHTGNLWKHTADHGTTQEYTRLKDGVVITGPQPQYFQNLKSIADNHSNDD